MNVRSEQSPILIGIKLLHTAVWVFFVLCVAAIPLAAAGQLFRATAVLSGVVLVECLVLAANRGRCPLTNLATRYSTERTDNFDIYLPAWLARYNKTIFGALFVAGELFALTRWMMLRL